MYKKILSLFLCAVMVLTMLPSAALAGPAGASGDAPSAAPGDVPIDAQHFPDAAFRDYLTQQPGGEDGVLTEAECAAITSIFVTGKKFADLTGLAYFPELKDLTVQVTEMTELDLSGNPKLTRLMINSVPLQELDVSGNPLLQSVYVRSTEIYALDLSGLSQLTTVFNAGNMHIVADNTPLSALPGLDADRASIVSGGTFVDGRVVFDEGSSAIRYTYDSGCPEQTTGTELVYQLIRDRVVPIDEANFPDPRFRTYLQNTPEGADGQLTTQELAADMTEMLISTEWGVTDLTGMENFHGLVRLIFDGDLSKELDISAMYRLDTVMLANTSLQSLKITDCPFMASVECTSSQLLALELHGILSLVNLNVSGNRCQVEDGTPLAELPLDPARAREVHGGSFQDGKVVYDRGCDTITYAYDTGFDGSIVGAPGYYDGALPVFTMYRESVTVPVDESSFPDPVFRKYVSGLPGGEDGMFTLEELEAIKKIDCSRQPIADLTGVELFMNLEELHCWRTEKLQELHLEKLKKLKILSVDTNRLTKVDLSHQPLLEYLGAVSNGRIVRNRSSVEQLGIDPSLACHVIGGAFVDGKIVFDRGSDAIRYTYPTGYTGESSEVRDPVFTLLLDKKVPIDEKHFPDPAFRSYVASLPGGEDGVLTAEERLNVASVACIDPEIRDLTGLQYFPAMSSIKVSTQAPALDLAFLQTVDREYKTSRNTCSVRQGASVETLPGFDPERACHVTGGAFVDGKVVFDPGSEKITYAYDTGAMYRDQKAFYPVTLLRDRNVVVSEENFPDQVLRRWAGEADQDQDGVLSAEELAAVTSIHVEEKHIRDLTGIEHFMELRELHCARNDLRRLDLRQNTELEYLDCQDNLLTELLLSPEAPIAYVDCSGGQLAALDVSAQESLQYLDAANNERLTEQNTPIEALPGFDPARAEDIRGGAFVDGRVVFDQGARRITYTYPLDGQETGRREAFSLALVEDVRINKANFPDPQFRACVKKLPGGSGGVLTAEELLAIRRVDFSQQDIEDLTGIQHLAAIRSLDVSGNGLGALDVSCNRKLDHLDVSGNELRTLNLSGNPQLQTLLSQDNRLEALDLSASRKLVRLDLGLNQLTELDVSRNQALQELYVSGNQLAALDVSQIRETDVRWEAQDNLYPTRDYPVVTAPGLDAARIVEGSLTGGRIDGTALRFDEGSFQMSYTYQVSGTKTQAFTIRHDHSFGPWTVVTVPQEDREGLRERVCPVCGHVEQQVLPALGELQHPICVLFSEEKGSSEKITQRVVQPGESVRTPRAGGLFARDLCWRSEDGSLTVRPREELSYAQLREALGFYVPEGSQVVFRAVSVPASQEVDIRFVDGGALVSEVRLTVDDDLKKLSAEQVKEYLPEGYELAAENDFTIRKGAVQVAVQRQAAEDAIRVVFQLRGMGHLEGQKGKTMTVVLEPGESVTAPRAEGMFHKVREVKWSLEDGFHTVSDSQVSYETLLELLGGTVSQGAQVTFTGKAIK